MALAWAVLSSTGMIHACLKTIPQWNTRLVPAAYLANGHLSGALILLVLAAADQRSTKGYASLALLLLLVAAGIKWLYYRKFLAADRGAHSLSSALGMTAARAKLLDAGHSHATFLTEEFLFQLGRARARRLRALFFVLSVGVPALVLALGAGDAWILALTALLCITGLLIERWLFFAEAQHVVRLFYGQQTV